MPGGVARGVAFWLPLMLIDPNSDVVKNNILCRAGFIDEFQCYAAN